MGKTAKFDKAEVIEKATNLYWQKGFHGTSMRNLQDVIDMRPGSIYSAFGSKENLFREAIHNYASKFDGRLAGCLSKEESTLQGIKRFIKKAVVEDRDQAPSGMCMLVKTVAELTEEQGELLNEAKQLLSNVEKEFARVIQVAIDAGEIDASKDAELLAKYLQVQLIGLRTYLRASDDESSTHKMIDSIFEEIAKK